MKQFVVPVLMSALLLLSNPVSARSATVHIFNKSKSHTVELGISGSNAPKAWQSVGPGQNVDIPVPKDIGPDPEEEGPRLYIHGTDGDSAQPVNEGKDTYVILLYNRMWVQYAGATLKEAQDTLRAEKAAGQ